MDYSFGISRRSQSGRDFFLDPAPFIKRLMNPNGWDEPRNLGNSVPEGRLIHAAENPAALKGVSWIRAAVTPRAGQQPSDLRLSCSF